MREFHTRPEPFLDNIEPAKPRVMRYQTTRETTITLTISWRLIGFALGAIVLFEVLPAIIDRLVG